MKKILLVSLILVVVLAGVLVSVSSVLAFVPSLSVYSTGSGDSVQITVNGDSNSSVTLYYQPNGYYNTQSQYLGSTNYNGYFSTTVSASSYGITSGSSVYVMVNGQQSSSTTWPYNNNYYNGNYGSISLSQSNVSMGVGQSVTVTISGGYTLYSMYPGSPNLYQVAIGGSTLTITGRNVGSDTLKICSSGSTTSCTNLYIVVNNNSNYYNNNYYNNNQPILNQNSAITFSQNNVYLSIGQTMNVSVYGGLGYNYNVAYNSNLNTVQSNLSGSMLTISGLANGSAAIVICSAGNNCSALNVSVGSMGSVLGAQNNWTFCANEDGYCSFYGTQLVRFGTNSSYYYRTVTGGTSCTNAIFGDPIFGYVKQCSYGGSR